jgi:hypothetical protein
MNKNNASPLRLSEEKRRERRIELAHWIFERNRNRWCEKGWFACIPIWASVIEGFLYQHSPTYADYLSSSHLILVFVRIPSLLIADDKHRVAYGLLKFMKTK